MDERSLRLLLAPPPIYTEDLDSPLPESILLDPFGYVSDRTNATTADGRRSRRKRILVTFWVATPPRVSCFTVHCPDLKPDAFDDMPKVVCTEDDLVLLRIAVCPDPQNWWRRMYEDNTRYFVCQTGTKNMPPSLSLVRTPKDFRLSEHETVLLRRRDQDMFFLAVLRWSFIDWQNTDKYFDLHLYNSKTGRWSTRLMYLDPPQGFRYDSPSKGIAIGGEFGSVGWVDLWKGILICDLLRLEDNQSLRYIPVPSPPVANPFMGYPQCVRDVIVLQGYIKFFEMHTHARKVSSSDTDENSWITEGWVAATKKLKISSMGSGSSNNNWDYWDWEEDCAIKCSDDVPVDGPVYAQMMLSNLQDGLGGDTKPTLKRIQAGYPAMSLHDCDVVYIMHTPDHCKGKAYVIALDMRNKTVQGVAGFGSGIRPLGYGFTYLQSGISKHLST